MMAVETAHESLTAIMEYPIATTFYVCSYNIVRRKAQEEEMQKWKRKH